MNKEEPDCIVCGEPLLKEDTTNIHESCANFDSDDEVPMEDCPNCDGIGCFDDSTICKTCDGEGLIEC